MAATDGGWRVSDAEREAVAAALGMHLAAGRLSMAEFRARLEAIYAATTPADLAAVTTDLPQPGSGPAGEAGGPAGPLPGSIAGPDPSSVQRALTRFLAVAALLAASAMTGVILLIAALLGHGSLLVAGLVLLFAPVALVVLAAGGVVWVGRRAWRSGAWLEAVPAAAGMPWVGRAAWALRVLFVSRVLARVAGLAGRPLRPRRAARPGQPTVWYQDEPGGRWHQARVSDTRGRTR